MVLSPLKIIVCPFEQNNENEAGKTILLTSKTVLQLPLGQTMILMRGQIGLVFADVYYLQTIPLQINEEPPFITRKGPRCYTIFKRGVHMCYGIGALSMI